MRRGILFLSFLLFGTFVFSADFSCAAGPTIVPTTISKETTWTKANGPYLIKSNVYVQARLEIEPGTVVKFWAPSYSLYINADFSARGTKNEKVVFTSIHDDSDGVDSDKDFTTPRPPQSSDWKSIYINPAFKIEFVNAIIDYGKVALWATSTGAEHENLTIRNSQVSHAVTGIYMENVEPVIESNLITGNSTGVIFFANNGLERKLVLSGNSFSGNGKAVYGFNTNHRGEYCVDARNNWWNDASGPKDPIGNPAGKGDATNAPDVVYDPWLAENPNVGLDPVIIIPGIMGSWQVDGKWKIDPIFHTYDNLRDEFLANGYEDGKTFFTFPYEWRNSNVDNAKLLAKKIEEIKKDTGRLKVDIVAHSMGGLLAREYIESDYYAGDVDQLITVGTPQLGAPKDYVTWEAGEFADYWSPVIKRVIALEALENGYLDIFSYVHNKPISSVQELLPTYNYLYDVKKSYALRESYPDNYPRNEFLEKLNNSDKVKLLKNTEFTKIIGKRNDASSTLNAFNVEESGDKKLWNNGYPKYFDWSLLRDQGLRYGDGDGTVPLYSSEASDIHADKKIFLQSEHNNLPTDAQKEILEILIGKKLVSEVKKWHIPSILTILLHSPIDVQVESPSGEKIGKNFETGETYDEIEGAYYSGFDTNTEFLTIPNPEDGEYTVLTEGTGAGEYTIETAKIAEDESTGETNESIVTITGMAEPQVQEEHKIEIDGDSVKKVLPLTFFSKNKEEKNSVEGAGTVLGASQIHSNDQESRIQQLDALKGVVRAYFKTNQIKTRKEAATIAKRLGHIRVHLKNYDILVRKRRVSQKVLSDARKKTNQHIDGLSSHVIRNFPKKIEENAKNDLIEKINDLKIVI